MSLKIRSPFGAMVRAERRSRGWTQARLAAEASEHLPVSERRRNFTERSIVAFERMTLTPPEWISPRSSNVEAIAAAFGFAPGTASHQALVEAAASTRNLSQSVEEPKTTTPRRPRFVTASREEYLAQIAERVDRAAEGTPQALALSADSGTGKTWLLVEACRRAVIRHPHLTVLWSSSSIRLGTPEPYQPFRQLLRLMIGGDRTPSPDYPISSKNRLRIQSRIPVALTALDTNGRDLLNRLIPVSALANDSLRTRPDLQPLVTSLAAHPAGQQRGTPDESLRRVIEEYAEAGLLIVVLEDLHASDAGTIQAISSILRAMHGTVRHMMVVVTFRPTFNHHSTIRLLEPLVSTLTTLYPDSRIDMTEALQPDASERFIAALAKDMGLTLSPEEIVQVREQTLGLPIFVDGALHLRQARDRGFAEAGATSTMSHTRILDAELDLLAPETRAALVAASVQGETFALEILSRVVGLPTNELESQLNDTPFWRRGLVRPAGELIVSRHQLQEFRFAHALMRDHLYEACLSDIERAHLHRLTADALISLAGDHPDDLTGLIAHHLEQAGDAVPAGEAWLASGNYLVDQDEFEAARFAFDRIRKQNLRLAAPRLEAEALLGLGTCARALDQHDEATAWIERGLEFARRRTVPDIEARLLSQLGMLAYDAGQVERGTTLVTKAIALHERSGDLAEAARSLARLSHNLYGMGRYDEAAQHAQRSIDLAASIGRLHLVNGGQIALANCWLDIGRIDDAAALYRATLITAGELGDTHRCNICLINLALCQIEQERWQEAEATQAPFLDRTRPVVPRFMGTVAFQWGLIAEGEGRLDDAHRHFEASLDVRQHNGQDGLLIDSLAGLLRVATARNELDTIRRLMTNIDDHVDHHGLDGIEHGARVCTAMIEGGRATGNWPAVHRYAESGVVFLRHRAALMANEEDRRTYLEVVPTHRRLLTLAEQVANEDEPGNPRSIASD